MSSDDQFSRLPTHDFNAEVLMWRVRVDNENKLQLKKGLAGNIAPYRYDPTKLSRSVLPAKETIHDVRTGALPTSCKSRRGIVPLFTRAFSAVNSSGDTKGGNPADFRNTVLHARICHNPLFLILSRHSKMPIEPSMSMLGNPSNDFASPRQRRRSMDG